MKQTTNFKGWLNYSPDWEFDMPVYMLQPVSAYCESGNDGGIDELIEDYQITLSMGNKPNDYLEDCDPEEKKYVKSMFTRAKNNKARKGIFYWKKTIEWDDKTFESSIIEDIKVGKDGWCN